MAHRAETLLAAAPAPYHFVTALDRPVTPVSRCVTRLEYCCVSATQRGEKMRRSLMLVVAVALAALVFAPAAFAQDDNPTGDDLGGDGRRGQRSFDDNPGKDDLGADDNCRGGGGAPLSITPRGTT
jgi:hypothetical protein